MHLIPFDSPKLPSKRVPIANAFAVIKSAAGFPVISIKGKVFHIKRGDETEMVAEPGKPKVPARSLEVVILGTAPGKSKVYYKSGYIEGSTEKPDCLSSDGIAPSVNAQTPQAKKCATCPHNAWGSKISENGKKGKACSDTMRLAVAPAGMVSDAMLLRVPAGSFEALGLYGQRIGNFGYQPHEIVTEVSFDFTVAHQALTFHELGIIPEDSDVAKEIAAACDTDIVKQIIGAIEMDPVEKFESPAIEAPKAEPVKAAKPPVDDFPTEPKADTKVEKPKAAKPAPAEDVAEEVGAMLADSDEIDFDD